MTSPAPDRAAASLLQPVAAGVLAAFVGFGSSFAVIVAGLNAMGATPDQAASGLTMLTIGMGLAGMALSLWTRMPISVAWSTPGGALLATTAAVDGGFPAVVGAFLVTGALLVVAGLWKPFGRLVAAIPGPLAGAMLAGILLPLVLAPFRAVGEIPLLMLPVMGVWLIVGRFWRLYAVPAAVLAAVAALALDPGALAGPIPDVSPTFELVTPAFTLDAIVGVALPLFLVTMASQNIPGLVVLATYGYRPHPGPLVTWTGVASVLVAPFGALSINLAAITAALCAGPDAHPQPERRWIAAFAAGCAYVPMGLAATAAVVLVTLAPPLLIQGVAGLALLGAFAAAILKGLEHEADRTAALVTFLLAASGLSFLGIGSAFWGLIAGLAVSALHGRLWRREG
jgi:benzoate membrane transport protein